MLELQKVDLVLFYFIFIFYFELELEFSMISQVTVTNYHTMMML